MKKIILALILSIVSSTIFAQSHKSVDVEHANVFPFQLYQIELTLQQGDQKNVTYQSVLYEKHYTEFSSSTDYSYVSQLIAMDAAKGSNKKPSLTKVYSTVEDGYKMGFTAIPVVDNKILLDLSIDINKLISLAKTYYPNIATDQNDNYIEMPTVKHITLKNSVVIKLDEKTVIGHSAVIENTDKLETKEDWSLTATVRKVN